jgi:HEAT repeat protein
MSRQVSSFSNRSLAEWTNLLQQGTTPEQRYTALLAMKSMAGLTETVRWSTCALRDTDAVVRALAAKMLGESRRLDSDQTAPWNDVAAELHSSLSDADPDVRFEAARTWGRIRPTDETARNVLMSLLQEAEVQPLMLASIITALAERTDLDFSALTTSYSELLAHKQAEVRESVSAAVTNWGIAAAPLVPALVTALEDEEPLVRESSAIALGRAGVATEQVAIALRAASSDEDDVVATVARESLSQLGLTCE